MPYVAISFMLCLMWFSVDKVSASMPLHKLVVNAIHIAVSVADLYKWNFYVLYITFFQALI